MNESHPVCTGRHRDDHRPPADLGLLCTRCVLHLRADLTSITSAWHTLPDNLLSVTPTDTGTPRRRLTPPAPVNLHILDLADDRTDTGWQLTRAVVTPAHTLALAMNLHTRPGWQWPDNPAQAADLLLKHLDTLVRQDWLGQALPDVRKAANTLRVATGLTERRWTVGACTTTDPTGDDDESLCGGDLRVQVHHDPAWNADRDPYHRRLTVSVRCQRCHDEWTEADLYGYIRVHDMWLHPSVVADLLDTSARTVREWIHAGYVRRAKSGLISWADALARASRPRARPRHLTR